MNRRAFLTSAVVIATATHCASAQTVTKTFSIGWLTAQRASSLTPFLDVFRSGLAELGYREADNLEIEYRYGDDNLLRVAPLAAELTRQPVKLLVVQGAAVPLVHELKLSIPSVYVFSGDPVVAGIAESLARPGGNIGGLIATAGGLAAHRKRIIELASRHKLPAIYPFRYYATDGGMISYGPDTHDPIRRAAEYVDRILRGEKPADLPVQAPTKYELVINLKTAKALGLEVPPTLLARADEVIE